MTLLESLRAARTSAATAYQSFLLTYPKFPRHVHAFFEGHDDPAFYLGFLYRFTPADQVQVYKCGSKDGVYEAHGRVMLRHAPGGIVLFFVDKDLADVLGEERPVAANIFVTDYYSMENYLVTEEMFRRIWHELFRFDLKTGGVDLEAFVPRFHEELARPHRDCPYVTLCQTGQAALTASATPR